MTAEKPQVFASCGSGWLSSRIPNQYHGLAKDTGPGLRGRGGAQVEICEGWVMPWEGTNLTRSNFAQCIAWALAKDLDRVRARLRGSAHQAGEMCERCGRLAYNVVRFRHNLGESARGGF